MSRKKRIILIILLAACGAIVSGVIFKNGVSDDLLAETGPIKAERIMCIGSHIYYPEDMYALTKADEDTRKAFFDYLEKLDKNLDYDIYVCGMNKGNGLGELSINAYQYLDGAIIPNVFYRSSDSSDKVQVLLLQRGTPVSDIDTSDLKPAADVTDVVLNLAEQHSSELYYEDYNDRKITGTYRLEYDNETGELYYAYRINEYSEVRIDSKTGDIIYSYFWDGTIED